jgi:hypothetical protein
MLLTPSTRENILKRFPSSIKLAYETQASCSLSADYDIGIAVPYGQKSYIWFTFFENKQVCCVCELTRNQVIGERVYFAPCPFPKDFALGTIISGIFVEKTGADSLVVPAAAGRVFLIDDIYLFKGYQINANFQPSCLGLKIKHMAEFCSEMDKMCETKPTPIQFCIPMMWKFDSSIHRQDQLQIPIENIPYDIKHLQYISSRKVLPLMNVAIHRKPVWNPNIIADDQENIQTKSKTSIWTSDHSSPPMPTWRLCYHRQIYFQPCHFWVEADLAFDVYHLYAKTSKPVHNKILYQYAFVPDMATSKMLNGIFRHIKEDSNLDAIEESDSEEDFENVRESRFVNLHKTVLMECVFDKKFKKWIPTKVADKKFINELKVVPYLDQLIVR